MLRHIIYTFFNIMARHSLYKLFINPATVWPKESCLTFWVRLIENVLKVIVKRHDDDNTTCIVNSRMYNSQSQKY